MLKFASAYTLPAAPKVVRKFLFPAKTVIASTKAVAFSGSITKPRSDTTEANSVPTFAIAITGRALANIPVNLDGITKSAASARCGSK